MVGFEGAIAAELPPDWSPRFYRDGDEHGIYAVLAASFERWPKAEIAVDPVEHLRWKLSSHLDLPRHHVVAELDGQIVGTQAILVLPIKVNGRVLLASQGVDFAVHPQYRKKGVRSRMNSFSIPDLESLDLHYTLESGHPAMLRVQQRNEVEARPFANRIEALVHPLRPLFSKSGRSLRRSDSPISLAHGVALSAIASVGRLRRAVALPQAAAWTVRTVDRFEERFDRFWKEASAPFAFIVERSQAYLNWRYADPRAGAFTILVANEAERVLGYIVLQCSYGEGFIADLLVLPGRLDIAASLLRSALVRFREAGVSTVEYWSPRHHPYRAVVRGAGFLCKRQSLSIWAMARQRSKERLALVDDPRAAIHVGIGDTDMV